LVRRKTPNRVVFQFLFIQTALNFQETFSFLGHHRVKTHRVLSFLAVVQLGQFSEA
jgi:hypothetical protein